MRRGAEPQVSVFGPDRPASAQNCVRRRPEGKEATRVPAAAQAAFPSVGRGDFPVQARRHVQEHEGPLRPLHGARLYEMNFRKLGGHRAERESAFYRISIASP